MNKIKIEIFFPVLNKISGSTDYNLSYIRIWSIYGRI